MSPAPEFAGSRAVAATLAAILLTACTVGPDYRAPEPAMPASFAEAAHDEFDSAQAPGYALWAAFDDPVLTALIETALADNRGLAQALAQLNEARAIRGLETFALYPIVTSSAGAQRQQPSAADPFIPRGVQTTDTYEAGFDAAWEIDLFGGARRTREALAAEVGAAAADLTAARLALVGEVAQAYFSYRAEQARLAVQWRQVENLQENLRLLELLRDEGRGTELDVARSNALGLGIAARLPLTRAAVARHEQRLAVLMARSTAELRELLGPERPLPTLPELVSVGTPEDWLRRRPDVAAAERRLAAATAQVGVSVAELFPKLELTGGFGWTAQDLGDLGNSEADRYRFGPSLSWRFLDIGRARQEVLAAEARAAGVLAAYEETVLLALEEIETSLANWRESNRSAALLAQAVVRAGDALELAELRFEAGAADTLVVLDAERTLLDLEDQLATAGVRRATALAALYKALAGDFASAP